MTSVTRIRSGLPLLSKLLRSGPLSSQRSEPFLSTSEVEAELRDLVEALKKSPTFSRFTKDLSVPADIRVKAIQQIANQAKFSEPLPPEEEKELKETLKDIIGRGKKVNLEQKVDSSILGGLVVGFGQRVFDMSIKTRVRQMERFLREPVNFSSL